MAHNNLHVVEVYVDPRQLVRWRRRAHNGQIIAASGEGYSSLAECHEAIFRVFGVPWTIDIVLPEAAEHPATIDDPWQRGDRAFEERAVKDEESW